MPPRKLNSTLLHELYFASLGFGAGFAAAALSGEENADGMRMEEGRVAFLSNNAGGIFGGISTGQDIVARFAVN